MTPAVPAPARPEAEEQQRLLLFFDQEVRLYTHRQRLEARQLYATTTILDALKRSRRTLRGNIARQLTAIPSTSTSSGVSRT
jgi:hypothetical protein